MSQNMKMDIWMYILDVYLFHQSIAEYTSTLKTVQKINELFDVIPEENILSAIDDFGLDYSEDLSDKMLIEDGKLYRSGKVPAAETAAASAGKDGDCL